MGFADNFLPKMDQIRTIMDTFGFRKIVVTRVKKTYSAATDLFNGKDSGATLDSVRIVNFMGVNPKVKYLNQKDYLRGAPQDADLEVSQITPDYTFGGLTYQDMFQDTADEGSEIYYTVSGKGFDGTVKYEIAGFDGGKKLGFKLYLKRASNQT